MVRRLLLGVTVPVAGGLLLAAPGCGGHGDKGSSVDAASAMPAPTADAAGSAELPEASSSDASSSEAEADALTPPLPAVNKIDLLFDIDNSASMDDKQEYLAQAVPDLLRRLVTPDCVDSGGNPTGVVADANGNCSIGTIEFAPVHDLHIGIVTSSLGPRLGDACDPAALQSLPGGGSVSRHNDDQGHLVNRAGGPNYTEHPLPDLGTADFLDWFPQAPGDGGLSTPARLVRLRATAERHRVVHPRPGPCGLQRRDAHAAGLRQGLPDDPRAAPREAPR